MTTSSFVYHSDELRACEMRAIAAGISRQTMMQRAGEAACDVLLQRWPLTKKIAVFCGGGYNGGDGYVLARSAHDRGIAVTIWQAGKLRDGCPELVFAHAACKERGIFIQPCGTATSLDAPDVVVDAVCGIGLQSPVREAGLIALRRINAATCPVLALDMPSGIHADTGAKLGEAVCATATITFIGLKLGLLTGAGIACRGELTCDPLGLPESLLAARLPMLEQADFATYCGAWQPRTRNWHKGLSGRVLVVGGAPGFSGAPLLAAIGALRVGAGLVSMATHPQHAAMANLLYPEIMCHSIDHPQQLAPLVTKLAALVIGPGLGQATWSREIWQYLLTDVVLQSTIPVIVDADGLNLLSDTKQQYPHWILTPHTGEAARLLKVSVSTIEYDRFAAAKEICQRYGGICVLKGAGTLIVAVDTGTLPAVCAGGNPGMASAGMGDMLSGVLGGLLAQGLSPIHTAKFGVCLHAAAGDAAAQQGERGMMASDLLPHIRRLANCYSSETC